MTKYIKLKMLKLKSSLEEFELEEINLIINEMFESGDTDDALLTSLILRRKNHLTENTLEALQEKHVGASIDVDFEEQKVIKSRLKFLKHIERWLDLIY